MIITTCNTSKLTTSLSYQEPILIGSCLTCKSWLQSKQAFVVLLRYHVLLWSRYKLQRHHCHPHESSSSHSPDLAQLEIKNTIYLSCRLIHFIAHETLECDDWRNLLNYSVPSLPAWMMGSCKVGFDFWVCGDEILWCDHSNETFLTTLFSSLYKMKFGNFLEIVNTVKPVLSGHPLLSG